MVEAGWLNQLAPFGTDFLLIQRTLARVTDPSASRPTIFETAERFVENGKATHVRPDGPLWDRQLAQADEESYRDTVTTILETLGIQRIVVAHTPNLDGKINSRFDGRVFVIETGAGPGYGGRPSALEIARDGRVRAVYRGESEILVEVTEEPQADP